MKLIFIAIDTLRADRLGCCGSHRPDISPNIDRLAQNGILFPSLIAENNVTQSSFVTIMTGKSPHQHGIVNMKPVKIPERLIPLPKVLQKNGYVTAAVDCNHRITGKPNLWFKRGYRDYLDPSESRNTHLDLPAQEINRLAIPWLKKHKHEQHFFLFLHYWDPHYPYMPDTEFARWAEETGTSATAKEPPLKKLLREPLWSFINKYNPQNLNATQIRNRYDAAVKHVDHYIGELLDALSDMGILEETCIILTSDHGESLGEHNIYFDHHGLYDTTVRLPLIIHWPNTLPRNRCVTALVQHADLFPTILQLARIRKPRAVGRLDGRSLLPLIQGKQKEIRPFAVSCEANWQLKRSIRTHRWKLIQSLQRDVYGNPKLELYHLPSDPGETRNVISRHPNVARALQTRMNNWVRGMLRRYRRKDPLSGGIKVSMHRATVAEEELVKKRLSELGY
ncbi:sulfatase family protein [Staphylospora marina]|uniref:sulfatase family protein n=1 Tax=Staphylospora marina TaxID=2490858 RepID=UPI0013DDBD90|nr:sulfatase [Staphylospora marina]